MEIAAGAGALVRYHPLNMLKVFAAAGSFPPAKYPQVRQTHRKADMARWAEELGVPINTTPAFWPVPMELACSVIVAAGALGIDQGKVTGAILSAVWEKDLNIALESDLRKGLIGVGLDAESVLDKSETPQIKNISQKETEDAISLGIFGSPTYVVDQNWFFGQDRLDFLHSDLSK
ncbi:2-hydroxychromene-2-carboxylate isomerase [Octadecabacter sp. CECT 8868]|nr:2-hydroxychromene-2-carboxylate isomerase [Octadecabacter algicola]